MTDHQPITGPELEEMQTRCDKARFGPWFVDETHISSDCDIICDYIQDGNDRAFIAHARTDLPRCIAEIEHLNAKCERLYRKGWRRVVDGETPICPDLALGKATLEDVSALESAPGSVFIDHNANPVT